LKWFSIPKMAISLPIAIVATAAMLGFNEVGFRESTSATKSIEEAQATRQSVEKLMQSMLDAETGQRGFLLTGNARYLEPYKRAMSELGQQLTDLRTLVAPYPEELAEFMALSRQIARKQSEIELSVRMRESGNEDAWRFVINTDVGQEQMDMIRLHSNKLMASSTAKMIRAQEKIGNTLLWSRIGIATLTLCGLIGFFMYLRQTETLLAAGKREQDALQRERDLLGTQVRERTMRLTELATHLQEVREDERGYLARELHDELGALLTAAKLDVARIRSRLGSTMPEASERLEHLTTTLNSGIALKRRIVEDLRPSSLSHLGLVASLEILAREFAERSGLQITTSLEPVELSGSAQLTVYRLVQESLTNMSKYAHARNAQIKLACGTHDGRDIIKVEVKDDGRGFNADKVASTSHGLSGMRHRVEAAGGQLAVESTEGHGTRISALLPKT
jgi:signal transduction histidine kinase